MEDFWYWGRNLWKSGTVLLKLEKRV